MLRIATMTSLAAYSVVASQPLAYIFFMTAAQRALSAPAYVELRQRINPVMNRRVPAVYLVALATVLLLLALALAAGRWSLVATTTAALLCLVVDTAFMLRENAPINGIMDRWSPSAPPADWSDYREKWFAVYAYRQIAVLVGFLSLLVGAVYG
ncbi:MAG TPA: hypothetical protein VFD92_17605 [Candidatus Binatia bacterium]|nr:hypothetical protein [Candidatus Binatia bacterium]